MTWANHKGDDTATKDQSGRADRRTRLRRAPDANRAVDYRTSQERFIETADFNGTDFQRKVWDALRSISAGQAVSYGNLAARIGRPTATRAVGLANGANPIAIAVPCHRVIGANNALTGFGGGLSASVGCWHMSAPAGHNRMSSFFRSNANLTLGLQAIFQSRAAGVSVNRFGSPEANSILSIAAEQKVPLKSQSSGPLRAGLE